MEPTDRHFTRITRRQFMGSAVLLAGGGLLAACAQPATTSTSPPPKGEAPSTGGGNVPGPAAQSAKVASPSAERVIIGMDAEPVIMDPHQIREVTSRRCAQPVFESLLQYNSDTFALEPALAEKWDVSPDGLSYTFYLRKGVKFHDDTPFNAQAVKFSFDRQLKPNKDLGSFPFGTSRWNLIEEVQVVDDTTVRFQLKERWSIILDTLASHNSAWIISPAAAEKWGKDFPLHPVGTGRYKFASWEKGKQLVYEANDGYWAGAPKVKQVVLMGIPESQPRVTALQTGTADWIYAVPPDMLDILSRDSNIVVQELKLPSIWYVYFNFKRKPFEDVRVRRALNYAIDKESLVKSILRGAGVAAKGPLGPVFGDAYDPSLEGYPYNPQKSKELLAEAGFPNGFNTTFIVPTSGAGMQQPTAMATLMQANWKAVGVNVEIKTVEFAAANDIWVKGDFDLAARATNPSGGDPENLLLTAFHTKRATTNYGFYASDEVDKLIDESSQSTDPKRRTEVHRLLQKRISEDAPWVFVDHEILYNAQRKGLSGVRLHPNSALRVDGISYVK